MTIERISAFIENKLPPLCQHEQRGDAGYALPPASLKLLRECVERLDVRRVFEFGTGRSTREFLAAGCTVASVEDSADWLAETCASIDPAQRERFTSFLLPLQRVWLGKAPVQSWKVEGEVLAALKTADLVLIDSPALPPSREHPLALALSEACNALIVVDDADIPTVARFCRRLSERNGCSAYHAPVDHGLFFTSPSKRRPVCIARPLIETLKVWRRFFCPRAGA